MCVTQARHRNELMQVMLRELRTVRVKKTEREWMVLLVGLSGETNGRMVEAGKETM